MMDRTPWFVGNGAQHSPEVARLLAYAGTSGAEGVVGVADMRVQSQAVAGASVRVLPGAALILNRYAGGGQQSYVARNATQTDIPVTATGSGGGRTDLVVARVLDPQYEGQPPVDPTDFDYARVVIIQGVPAGTVTAAQLNLGYPAIALAKITLPASTATVTQSMITDLREVAIPRRKTELRVLQLTGGQSVTLASGTAYPDGGQTFPVETEAAWGKIYIPDWATYCKIIMTWTGIGTPQGNAAGFLWAQVGGTVNPANFKTQAVKYDTLNAGGFTRQMYRAPDLRYIPAALRGTSQNFYPRGNVLSGAASARLTMDAASGIDLQVEFMEQAD